MVCSRGSESTRSELIYSLGIWMMCVPAYVRPVQKVEAFHRYGTAAHCIIEVISC